jgi:hypothetical protein
VTPLRKFMKFMIGEPVLPSEYLSGIWNYPGGPLAWLWGAFAFCVLMTVTGGWAVMFWALIKGDLRDRSHGPRRPK